MSIDTGVERWCLMHGYRPVPGPPPIPLGAAKLGCRNCRPGDRVRHPELGMVYCADCPVTHRCQARADRPLRTLEPPPKPLCAPAGSGGASLIPAIYGAAVVAALRPTHP